MVGFFQLSSPEQRRTTYSTYVHIWNRICASLQFSIYECRIRCTTHFVDGFLKGVGTLEKFFFYNFHQPEQRRTLAIKHTKL